jgi:hypothetical protein
MALLVTAVGYLLGGVLFGIAFWAVRRHSSNEA